MNTKWFKNNGATQISIRGGSVYVSSDSYLNLGHYDCFKGGNEVTFHVIPHPLEIR